jgi:hypothetical protein
VIASRWWWSLWLKLDLDWYLLLKLAALKFQLKVELILELDLMKALIQR